MRRSVSRGHDVTTPPPPDDGSGRTCPRWCGDSRPAHPPRGQSTHGRPCAASRLRDPRILRRRGGGWRAAFREAELERATRRLGGEARRPGTRPRFPTAASCLGDAVATLVAIVEEARLRRFVTRSHRRVPLSFEPQLNREFHDHAAHVPWGMPSGNVTAQRRRYSAGCGVSQAKDANCWRRGGGYARLFSADRRARRSGRRRRCRGRDGDRQLAPRPSS